MGRFRLLSQPRFRVIARVRALCLDPLFLFDDMFGRVRWIDDLLKAPTAAPIAELRFASASNSSSVISEYRRPLAAIAMPMTITTRMPNPIR